MGKCKCRDCPSDLDVKTFIVSLDAMGTTLSLRGSRSRRFFIVTFAPATGLVVLNEEIQVNVNMGGALVSIGACTPGNPSVEIDYWRHGQLVFQDLFLSNAPASLTTASITVGDLISTENANQCPS